jgi:hypothetical protein
VGEEEPSIDADLEIAETDPTGSVSGRDFRMHRVPVTRCAAGIANLPGGFQIESDHSVFGHGSPPFPLSNTPRAEKVAVKPTDFSE